MSAPTRRTRTDKLGDLAARVGAKRAPFYVGFQQAAETGKPPGWYWAGPDARDADDTSYLALGAGLAEHKLRTLYETQRAPA